MGVDFSAGSGSQEHSLDVTLNGPYLALTWRFSGLALTEKARASRRANR